jgi:hypothetical protein
MRICVKTLSDSFFGVARGWHAGGFLLGSADIERFIWSSAIWIVTFVSG